MSRFELQHITRRFPTVTALNDVSFSFADGEFFVLLGPTGAGKTTTLRIIAGLEKQDEGSILLDGQNIDSHTPAERDVAFVFQQYSLYPTMTVYDNLAFPLRSPMRKTSEPEIKRKVEEAAEKLRITQLLKRKTAQLSGGEMQRVAIGRAIVRAPRLFLMDEPLSNLDAKLREALRVELKHLQKTQGSTTLFVTHDQIEALTMADRIAVLNKGRIVQQGTPDEIYDKPGTTFVAQLVGTPKINLLPSARQDGTIHVSDSELTVPAPRLALPQSFLLGIRPEDIRPDRKGAFTAKVNLIEPLGVETILHLRSGDLSLLSLVPGMAAQKTGEEIRFDIVREKLHYFGTDGTRIVGDPR
jgi:multiple sugar transport system ATP-binding protein